MRETRERGDELEFRYCPYCDGGGSRDEWTFSINTSKGTFNCLRSSCGKQGHFVELCRDFGYHLDFEQPKIYRQLPQKPIEVRNEAVEYLKGRGIGEEVAKRYSITVKKEQKNILVFPFKDPEGRLVAVKYRKTDFKKGRDKNKEWYEKDTMPILFGMDQARDFDSPLVITEGQMDSLSVAEAGIANAVSVPTGATGFTWFSYSLQWLKQFKEIIVFGDCEHGHITLVDGISSRLKESGVTRRLAETARGPLIDVVTTLIGLTVGASVNAGQVIGHVGDSALVECCDEPHLHLEMTLSGVSVDPLDYVPEESIAASLTDDAAFEG